MGKKNNSYTAS